ncbi:MAG TPA: hypothetical protein VIH27_06480, partial [Nitrososphaerales archaeon]
MTEVSLQTALGKIIREPEFLGKCIKDIDMALKEANLDLDEEEKMFLRDVSLNEQNSEQMRLTLAFSQAKNQGMKISEYFKARREYALDYSSRYSYDTISDAINQMKKSFNTTLWMHRVTFYTGIVVIFASVYAAFVGMNLLATFLGVSGVADISYHFYKKPVEGVHKSIGNLVQLEVAFLGFINELGYWKLLEIKGDVEKNTLVTKGLRELTAMTMELIERYIERIPNETSKGTS